MVEENYHPKEATKGKISSLSKLKKLRMARQKRSQATSVAKVKKREETKKQIFQRLQIEKETEKTINSKIFFRFLNPKTQVFVNTTIFQIIKKIPCF